jgi:hypothetical protein
MLAQSAGEADEQQPGAGNPAFTQASELAAAALKRDPYDDELALLLCKAVRPFLIFLCSLFFWCSVGTSVSARG